MMDIPGPILRSEYREQIDNMLINGDTYVSISNWLRNNGEIISRDTISKYHKFCFNPNATAVELYNEKQSEKRLKDAAEKQVNTLFLYDKLIEAGAEINPELIDERARVDFALKAAKQREDFLKEHGDMEAEKQSQLLKEIRDELRLQDLTQLIQVISDERTAKRLAKATADI